jgi:hypothetical protein
MLVAATGVQACEWRLVRVARQFEVYCWYTTGRDARYRCLNNGTGKWVIRVSGTGLSPDVCLSVCL